MWLYSGLRKILKLATRKTGPLEGLACRDGEPGSAVNFSPVVNLKHKNGHYLIFNVHKQAVVADAVCPDVFESLSAKRFSNRARVIKC